MTSPTITSTFTKTPTWTPWPKLSQEDAIILVLDLFEKNAGCDLPCWWGFTPGESTWLELRGFLEQFAQLNTLVSDEDPHFYMDILVPVPEQINHQPLQQVYGVRNNIIESIEIQLGNASVPDLSEFLVKYGQPGEIWISTYNTAHSSDSLPFIIFLFYPDTGILAINGPETTTINNGVIRGCNFNKPASKYGLWSPKQKMTFEDASHVFRMNINEPGFLVLPIQDATNIDIETFYTTFKESNTTCIETPIELWPEQ